MRARISTSAGPLDYSVVMLLLLSIACAADATSGILVAPVEAPASGPTPAQRLGDCTRVNFDVKLDYQCGDVKAVLAVFNVKPGTAPTDAAAELRKNLARPTQRDTVSIDGASLEVDTLGQDASGRTFWAAFAVDGSTVREVLCAATAGDAGKTDCMRVMPLLAAYGPVEPEPHGAPPFAGHPYAAPEGCAATMGPAWHGQVVCPDGSALSWRSSPFVKDTGPHLTAFAREVGNASEGHPVGCTIDGVEGQCVRYDGAAPGAGLIVGYAVVRDDGVTLACSWTGGALPPACASILRLPS